MRLFTAAVLGLALVPATAAARPAARSYDQTYPYASRLCARADAGTLPSRLAASADQIKAACTTLNTAFTAAQGDFTTATAPLAQQATDAIDAAKSTCQTAIAAGDRASCRAALQQARTTLRGLRDQLRTALQAYRTAVNGARKAFWTTVRGLRGGAALKPDGTTTAVASAPALPSDAALS